MQVLIKVPDQTLESGGSQPNGLYTGAYSFVFQVQMSLLGIVFGFMVVMGFAQRHMMHHQETEPHEVPFVVEPHTYGYSPSPSIHPAQEKMLARAAGNFPLSRRDSVLGEQRSAVPITIPLSRTSSLPPLPASPLR
jgi:hypothetical protein